jgi:hypothetical protein
MKTVFQDQAIHQRKEIGFVEINYGFKMNKIDSASDVDSIRLVEVFSWSSSKVKS